MKSTQPNSKSEAELKFALLKSLLLRLGGKPINQAAVLGATLSKEEKRRFIENLELKDEIDYSLTSGTESSMRDLFLNHLPGGVSHEFFDALEESIAVVK